MITFAREPSHNYTMQGACGVVYKGEIHFFGGSEFGQFGDDGMARFYEFRYQHFTIETQRSGRMVKMTKKEDLDIGMKSHACSTFLPLSKEIVILCFPKTTTMYFSDDKEYSACFLFDGKITYIGQTNFHHYRGKLTQYKKNLIAIGGDRQSYRTEIMERTGRTIFKLCHELSVFIPRASGKRRIKNPFRGLLEPIEQYSTHRFQPIRCLLNFNLDPKYLGRFS